MTDLRSSAVALESELLKPWKLTCASAVLSDWGGFFSFCILVLPHGRAEALDKLGVRAGKTVDATAQLGIEVGEKCGEWKVALAGSHQICPRHS